MYDITRRRTVYNRTITPPTKPEPSDWLIHLVAAFLLLAVILGTWSNHFENGFHLDDEHTIVHNPAMRGLSGIPHFFRNPRAFSALPEQADYKPIPSSLFAVDSEITNGPQSFIFQAENFAWLLLEALCVYVLFRLAPGVNHATAIVAAAICALHPVIADVVNYPTQRGAIIGAAGLGLGLTLWIVWPRMLPAKLPLKFYQFPRMQKEEILRWAHPYLSSAWDTMLRRPPPFYFIPIVFAMLAEPSAVIFPLLMLVWIVLFEDAKNLRRIIPSVAVCGAFWLLRTYWVFRLTPGERLPLASYLYTQPWVAVRFIWRFLVPVDLSASLHLQPFDSPFAPFALLGYSGLALFIGLAVFTARRRDWHLVSFGLWWFLIAFAPQALVPQNAVSADERALVPLIGLAFALCSAGLVLLRKASALGRGGLAEIAAWTAAGALIGLMGFQTFDRNRVWQDDDTLWQDMVSKNPESGTALLNFGQLLMARGDSDRGFAMVTAAAARLPHDAKAEMVLAQACSHLDRDAEAETHFRKAVELDPQRARNFSVYAQWLSDRQRRDDAVAMARKALTLNDADLVSRHIVTDDFSHRFKWKELVDYAHATLQIAPLDDRSVNMISIGEAALEKISRAETLVKSQPNVDNHLALSVLYFQNQRYAESANAARKAVDLNPKLPFGYANIAAAYYAMGKLNDSIDALQEAVKLNPNLPGAKYTLDFELTEKSSVR